ncbi:MAG: NAD(P)/FAD-dependent oxidoreductase [Propionibacteriaceae bacterium]|nr:NAD(P)/FAD-dependent oxidoreductase [Propionibacteriaceae bacterium]
MTRDVVVIGAGVVGAAIARELSGYNLEVTLIEAKGDVGDGTSKANTAICHTGFDASPGTLESRLVHSGHQLLCEYANQTGIPIDKVSAMLVAWDDEQLQALPGLKAKAEQNGYDKAYLISAAATYEKVPDLGPGALGALIVPDESIICPWSTPLAFATEAVSRGAELMRDAAVTGVDVGQSTTLVHTTKGDVETRWVVNAAGLGGDTIEAMFGFDRFHLHPRRGELLVFDKLARPKVPVILLPVPSKMGKGVLISPTVFGNVMLGPTAEDMTDREDTATTAEGFDFMVDKARHLMPTLLDEEVTAAYAGLRAAHDQSDYVIEADAATRYAVAGCIRSTGLTSSMAVAEYVADLLKQAGLEMHRKSDAELPEPPKMPQIGEQAQRPFEDADLIASDPAYGRLVCFCERVSEGEIRDALHSEIPARDLGGVRRRTRAHNGRCQGFYCGAHLTAILQSSVREEI